MPLRAIPLHQGSQFLRKTLFAVVFFLVRDLPIQMQARKPLKRFVGRRRPWCTQLKLGVNETAAGGCCFARSRFIHALLWR